MSKKLEAALRSQGRRFIGGFGTRRDRQVAQTKQRITWGYGGVPINGEREVSRRLRQEIRQIAKSVVEFDSADGRVNFAIGTLWDQLISDPENYEKFRRASSSSLLEIRAHMLSRAG